MKRRTFIETAGKGSLLLLGLPALRCKGSKGSNNIAVETMTSGPLQHFFGYFGMNPWNQSENLMLALETGSQERFPETGEWLHGS